MIEHCPGAKQFRRPEPEYINCFFCGEEVEIWTDEFQTKCPKCKKTVIRKQGQSCLDWCKAAKECVGDKIYDKYLKSKSKDKS